MTDYLLETLRLRRPAALPLLVSAFGRDATTVAYLILEHRADATEAAARAFADLWVRGPEQVAELDRAALRTRLLGRAAAHALRLRDSSRSVDPDPEPTLDPGIRSLGPLARAVVALEVLGGLGAEETAELLEIPASRVAALRAAALGDDTGRLRSTLRTGLVGLHVTVDADMVRAAMRRPEERPSRRRWILAGAAPVAILIVLLAILRPADGPAKPLQLAASAAESPPAPTAAVDRPVARPAVALTPPGFVWPYTLGTCGFRDNLPVDYAGWVDAHLVDPAWTGADETVYALVTTDGTDRVACVYVREWGGYVRVQLDPPWAPATAADGCPVSPVGEYGGERELGGPGAFVVPAVTPPWVAGGATRLLVRIAPPTSVGGPIGASLRSPGGQTVAGHVTAEPVASLTSPSTGARHASYVWVDGLAVPTPGCWELNVTVGQAVVGAASLPFAAGN